MHTEYGKYRRLLVSVQKLKRYDNLFFTSKSHIAFQYMKSVNKAIIPKIIWIALLLFGLYSFGWQTFVNYTVLKGAASPFWNILVPGLVSLVFLLWYTKELWTGYSATDHNQNLNSLTLLGGVTVVLLAIQSSQFQFLAGDLEWKDWQKAAGWILVFTAYFGLLMNRIQYIPVLDSDSDTTE